MLTYFYHNYHAISAQNKIELTFPTPKWSILSVNYIQNIQINKTVVKAAVMCCIFQMYYSLRTLDGALISEILTLFIFVYLSSLRLHFDSMFWSLHTLLDSFMVKQPDELKL